MELQSRLKFGSRSRCDTLPVLCAQTHTIPTIEHALFVLYIRLSIPTPFHSAGGLVIDLKLIYDVSGTECYRSIYDCIDAINSCLLIEPFPLDDKHKLAILEAEFRAASYHPEAWTGQVAAADGVHFAMLNPGKQVPKCARSCRDEYCREVFAQG